MARFTVRVLKGDRLRLCINNGGADAAYVIKPEQAFKLATMLNFRAAQIAANEHVQHIRRGRGL